MRERSGSRRRVLARLTGRNAERGVKVGAPRSNRPFFLLSGSSAAYLRRPLPYHSASPWRSATRHPFDQRWPLLLERHRADEGRAVRTRFRHQRPCALFPVAAFAPAMAPKWIRQHRRIVRWRASIVLPTGGRLSGATKAAPRRAHPRGWPAYDRPPRIAFTAGRPGPSTPTRTPKHANCSTSLGATTGAGPRRKAQPERSPTSSGVPGASSPSGRLRPGQLSPHDGLPHSH